MSRPAGDESGTDETVSSRQQYGSPTYVARAKPYVERVAQSRALPAIAGAAVLLKAVRSLRRGASGRGLVGAGAGLALLGLAGARGGDRTLGEDTLRASDDEERHVETPETQSGEFQETVTDVGNGRSPTDRSASPPGRETDQSDTGATASGATGEEPTDAVVTEREPAELEHTTEDNADERSETGSGGQDTATGDDDHTTGETGTGQTDASGIADEETTTDDPR